MRIFFDSSAFVKRYTREEGTDEVLALCDQATELCLSGIALIEIISGFCRLQREGRAASQSDINPFAEINEHETRHTRLYRTPIPHRPPVRRAPKDERQITGRPSTSLASGGAGSHPSWYKAAPSDIRAQYFGGRGSRQGLSDEEEVCAQTWESLDKQGRQVWTDQRRRLIADRAGFDALSYAARGGADPCREHKSATTISQPTLT